MLYVTHDQVEAMTLADRIVVRNQGRIEQVGTPQHLYDRPATRFVAGFIGTPRMNLIEATVRAAGPDRSRLHLAGGAVLRAEDPTVGTVGVHKGRSRRQQAH